MASVYEIFARAERIERTAAEVYRVLGESFDWTPSDRALFKRLEQEEIQHAARIRLLSARYRTDAHLFDAQELSLKPLDDLERAGQALLDEIGQGRWIDDLEGLKARLAELERASSASHADVLAACAEPAVTAFFEELAAQDRGHGQLLLGALAQPPRPRRGTGRGDD
jgi:rubrerythrin